MRPPNVDSSFQYGAQDEHGNWDGMIEEVIRGTEDGGADFAVADLSITSSRASAVTFSMPWMTLGNKNNLSHCSNTKAWMMKKMQ